MKLWFYIVCLVSFPLFSYNIGLCITATNKYITFVQPLIESCKKNFLTDHAVHYYIFSDIQGVSSEEVTYIYAPHTSWPSSTLNRFEYYLKNFHMLEHNDFLFAIDADMIIPGRVGTEILGDLTAVLHPGFYNKHHGDFPYETRRSSSAFIDRTEKNKYFAGGFYGGSKEGFYELLCLCVEMIKRDLAKNIIAVWHDESYLNKFFSIHTPSIILDPSYCYPESWHLPYEKKIIALDKNHKEIRK